MTDDLPSYVWECANGAMGDLTRSEVIDHIAARMVDWVYEAFLEEGIDGGEGTYGCPTIIDPHVYRVVERLMASAMLHQHEWEQAECSDLVAWMARHKQPLQQPAK